MSLREFGEEKAATFARPSLSDCNGYLGELIGIEGERPMARNGVLQLRLDLVEEARQLLEVAENGSPKIMREVMDRLQRR
jgi:hypothetical protein